MKLIKNAGDELATVRVDKDATIGRLVAKIKFDSSLPEVARCSFFFDDDPGNECNRLASSVSAPFFDVASALITAQVIEKPITELELSISETSCILINIGLNQNIINLDAHLEVIQDELVRWEAHPLSTLRIASLGKNILDKFYQMTYTVVSVSSTSVLKIELMALKHTMVSAKMIASPVLDVIHIKKSS